MKKYALAGVVVLYNPSKENIENINNYIDSLEKLYVIDNSEKESEYLIKSPKIFYQKNPTNLGIATALNIGAQLAIKDNFNWLLTLDQDSKINNEIVSQMLEYLRKNNCKNIGLISPYHDIVTFDKKPEIKVEKKLEVMTSGNIINLKAYVDVGGFKDWLFIDCVDIEYGMNLNFHNYKVLRLNYIVMPHNLGNSQIVNFFGKKVIISNHNAIRRYYMIRNTLYVNQLYKNKYPEYCHMLIRAQLGQIKRIIFLEHDKFQKIKMTIKGVIDYKRNITGKLGGNKHV